MFWQIKDYSTWSEKKKKSECYLESNGNKNVYVVGKKKKKDMYPSCT